MKRKIVNFGNDDVGDWRAELNCGHYQHVRHAPPLIVREWVLSDEGRKKRIGLELECKKCDSLPGADSNFFATDFEQIEPPDGQNAARLIDYIIQKHHSFTRQEIVRLSNLFETSCQRKDEFLAVLLELRSAFSTLCNDLASHLEKEESILFPYLKNLESRLLDGRPFLAPPFGSANIPVRTLRWEHDEAKHILSKIRSISDEYRVANGADPDVQELYAGLQKFETDLYEHMRLEDDVLFPLAASMEVRLTTSRCASIHQTSNDDAKA